MEKFNVWVQFKGEAPEVAIWFADRDLADAYAATQSFRGCVARAWVVAV